MSDSEHKEFEAFTHFFSTFDLARPVSSVADISDGTALFQILSIIDSNYFSQSERASAQSQDNWVLRFAALKRLYRLMTQYFTDVLQKPMSGLNVPDLQALAKDNSVAPALGMCRLTIAIGVQCEKNKEFIEKIQGLSESNQHQLMRAIEQTMVQIVPSTNMREIGETMTEDDHYYMIQTQRSQIFSEKVSVEKAYRALLEEHRTLQSNYDEIISDREETAAQLREMNKEMEVRRNEKSDVILRTEIERLRADLQKSEDNLALAESELDKQTSLATELTRRVDELQVTADEAARLKDQVDEYRHAADKLQKTENVMEKYKKKLQESADLRQRLKALEKQNASLVDTNASLEEEYRKVAAFKPLMESYKNQIADLETKNTTRTQDIENLKFELEQSKAKLRITTEERTRDSATLELYQERVRELELMSQSRPRATKPLRAIASDPTTSSAGDRRSGDDQWNAEVEAEMDDQTDLGLGGELDDAISGTTMTDLKIQIKKLERELDAVRKKEADASRVLVLENLLEDANRMKARYESDYLAAHREKLVLQMNLEEIRSGKSSGDSAEAAIALRQRLNETVEQLEALRKEHTELEVKFEVHQKELIIAKSDLTLVNKDQLDILATLRESVNEDKIALEADAERLKKLNRELNDKNRMQLEQVNALLLEKVNLQSEGIGQREKMLLRERDWGDLQSSLSGKELPKDVKSRLLELHEENVTLKEANKNHQEKLLKARQFIKQQDKLFKDQHAASISVGAFDEGEGSLRAQVKTLESDVARYKTALAEKDRRYKREHELLLSAIHTQGMRTMRQHVMSQAQYPRTDSSSWLNTQRKTVGALLFLDHPIFNIMTGGPCASAIATATYHISVIDGSVLEGGGQILRNAVALSALLCKPIVVENIRKGRQSPGLKNQHRTGLELAASISSAELIDASNASTRIVFKPDSRRIQAGGGTFVADTVTAGSTMLLLQTALPIVLFAHHADLPASAAETTLVLQGGTNAELAPQVDYIIHVLLPFLQEHFLPHVDVHSGSDPNATIQLKLERRGYYPKGGGVVQVQVKPLPRSVSLRPVKLLKRGRLLSIRGIAHYAHLTASVGKKMVQGVMERLKSAHIIAIKGAVNAESDDDNVIDEEAVQIECRCEPKAKTAGAGSGIVLWASMEGGALIGASAIGRKSLDPTSVGAQAAEELITSLKSRSCVDEWLQDQIIIYMALAQGESEVCCGVKDVTLHTQSAIWVAEQLTDAKFDISRNEAGMIVIKCRGIGFTPAANT